MCKCTSSAMWDGGKEVDEHGYCNYYCNEWQFCGDGENYQKGNFIDCTGCSIGKFFCIFLLVSLRMRHTIGI